MKMTPEHFAELRANIAAVLAPPYDKAAERARALGWSHERWRWFVLRAACPARCPHGLQSRLYTYLNDNHIDTALRAILGADWPAEQPPRA